MTSLKMLIVVSRYHLLVCTTVAHFMLNMILLVRVFVLNNIWLIILVLSSLNNIFSNITSIKTSINLCFHVTIQLILWWFRVRRHGNNSCASPRRTSVLDLIFLFKLCFQRLAFFNLLSFSYILVNLSRSIKHLLILSHLFNVSYWIDNSVSSN